MYQLYFSLFLFALSLGALVMGSMWEKQYPMLSQGIMGFWAAIMLDVFFSMVMWLHFSPVSMVIFIGEVCLGVLAGINLESIGREDVWSAFIVFGLLPGPYSIGFSNGLILLLFGFFVCICIAHTYLYCGRIIRPRYLMWIGGAIALKLVIGLFFRGEPPIFWGLGAGALIYFCCCRILGVEKYSSMGIWGAVIGFICGVWLC